MSKRVVILTDEEIDRLLEWSEVVEDEDMDEDMDEDLVDKLVAARLKA